MLIFLKPTQINHVKRITTLIKNLDIPLCVLGLGIGIGLDVNSFNDTKTNETMEKFVRAILEKSKSVGVRGELTFKYLNRLGFDENEINVLGCPSIYLNGPEYNITPPEINNDSKIALNITPSVKKIC
ncbi:polysaccharide pyruvyl transferase family protein [Methanobrevibacter arboriphilus]|uniref:polysaccharide pyruvyl transferase family protein n=1 Tax=Methanobrevibacter arboriphilus TaxID=39441 RepID=UPI000A61D764|nr:polysaccharide pyruvyl transferase family protein [Methanobrevibacter arboriphilus]